MKSLTSGSYIASLLQKAWNQYRNNLTLLLPAYLLIMIVVLGIVFSFSYLFNSLHLSNADKNSGWISVFTVIYTLVIFVTIVIWQLVTLYVYSGKVRKISILFKKVSAVILKYSLLCLLLSAVIALLSLAFVLPAIIVFPFLVFAPICFIEKEKIIPSIKGSYNLAKGAGWSVFVNLIILSLLMFILYALSLSTDLLSVFIFLEILVYFVVTPLCLAYLYEFYLDLDTVKNKEKQVIAPVGVYKVFFSVVMLLAMLLSIVSFAFTDYLATDFITDYMFYLEEEASQEIIQTQVSTLDLEDINRALQEAANEKSGIEAACEIDADCAWALGCCQYVPANEEYRETTAFEFCTQNCSIESIAYPAGKTLKCLENRCISLDIN